MNVSDLINLLEKLPSDAKIKVNTESDGDSSFQEITSCTLEYFVDYEPTVTIKVAYT